MVNAAMTTLVLVGLNKLFAVLVLNSHNFVTHQISVKDHNFIKNTCGSSLCSSVDMGVEAGKVHVLDLLVSMVTIVQFGRIGSTALQTMTWL